MAAEQAIGELHIIFPLLVGIIIGLIEAYFVYEDEASQMGKNLIGDIVHGAVFATVGTLIATNVPWIISKGFIPGFIENFLMVDSMGRSPVICGIIAVILLAKMVATHGATRGMQGMKEKMWHKLVVALLVGFSPYYIFALYEPVKNAIGTKIPYL